MKKLNIEITQAKLVSFAVQLKEDEPVVSATISLMTAGGKEITDYTIYSKYYNKDQQFDLPMTAIMPIRKIMDILEAAVVKHCNSNVAALPAPRMVEVVS